MFTIQYVANSGQTLMQDVDRKSRQHLAMHLCRFQRPITGVFEQTTVITKAIRDEMAKLPHNKMSRHALAFVGSLSPSRHVQE